MALGEEFFIRATDMGVLGGDTPMSDLLDAWGIDYEAFIGWLLAYRQALESRNLGPDEIIPCALVAAFETGYRARMAVEEANGLPEWALPT
jgi:hypothetical protein